MDDDKLIERLEEGVREAEELLRRRRDALAALKGKTNAGKKGGRGRTRGLRPGSIPAIVQAALKSSKQALTLGELETQLKKSHSELDLDSRKISLALSRYVRLGQYFTVAEDGKYSLK
jgi:hypothetical protein